MTKYYIAFITVHPPTNTAGWQTESDTLLFEQDISLTVGEIEREAKRHHKLAKKIEVNGFHEISHEEFLRNMNDGAWA